jgi:hypothetical protein
LSVSEPVAGYSIEDRVTRLEVTTAGVSTSIARVEAKVDRLDQRIDGRPSWAVVTLLGMLMTACGVLATVVATLLSSR